MSIGSEWPTWSKLVLLVTHGVCAHPDDFKPRVLLRSFRAVKIRDLDLVAQLSPKYDGKDYPITGSPDADMVSMKKIDDGRASLGGRSPKLPPEQSHEEN